MLRPIPRVKLPHVASYKAYTGNLGEGDTYSTTTNLKYVKIDDRKQYKYNNNGREQIGNAMMFYDYKNSTGLSAEPVINSIVTFGVKEYRILDFETLYGDSSTIHHYEILLK